MNYQRMQKMSTSFRIATCACSSLGGYRRGDEIYLDLQEMSLVRLGSVAQLLVGIFVGASGAVFIRSASRANNALEGPLEVFLFGSLVLIFLLSLRRKLDATGLLYISVLGSWALFAAMIVGSH